MGLVSVIDIHSYIYTAGIQVWSYIYAYAHTNAYIQLAAAHGGEKHLIRACVHDKVHNLFLESQEEPHPAPAAAS